MLDLTEDQRQIRSLAREFAEGEIAPHAAAWDREHHFPKDVVDRLGELGLLGVCVPEALGGAGADFLSYALVLEELSRADAGVGVTVSVHTSAVTLPLIAHGTDDQAQRWVPPLARGETLGAFCLTEPGAGSDAQSITSRVKDDRITGAKQWVTNGGYAGTLLVFARDAEQGISGFVVGAPADGLEIVREEHKMGLHSASTTDLSFDAVAGEPIGVPGKGMRIALSALDGGRIGISAQAVGIAQAALDLAISHAKERVAFGGPIGRMQVIQQKLADMQTEVEAARALLHRAARTKDAGRPITIEGAQAKLFASRTARVVTNECVQILGGYGYVNDLPAERYYRDAKITEIYEGTSEIQRLVIARGMLGDLATSKPA